MTRSTSRPPRHLTAESRKLWRDVTETHVVDDPVGRQLLAQMCEALDEMRQAQARVRADGMVLTTERGARAHPLLTTIAECRRTILAVTRALKLDVVVE